MRRGYSRKRQRQKKLTLIFADACSVYVARANELKYDEVEPTGSNPKRGWNWTRTLFGYESGDYLVYINSYNLLGK
jgi:hypothetical protein